MTAAQPASHARLGHRAPVLASRPCSAPRPTARLEAHDAARRATGRTTAPPQLHVDPEHYGWFFGANAFGLIAASQLNRLLVGRFTSTQVLGAATTLAALAALVVLAVAWTGAGGLWGIAAALFVFLSTLGILGPNTTALALEHHGERAGLASAVLGATQFTIAASAAWAVSALDDKTTALPMAGVVAAAACLSCLCFALRRRTP